jgi:hypothetical protein
LIGRPYFQIARFSAAMAVLRFSLRCDRIDVDNGYRDVDSSAFGAPASQLAWSSDGGASEAARYLTHEAIGLAGLGISLTLLSMAAIVAIRTGATFWLDRF